MRAKPGQAIAFVEETAADPPGGCVLWPYAKTGKGYGVVQFRGRMGSAHRVALILYCGFDRPGFDAAHEPVVCHTIACINPRHLSWKTRKQNHADKKLDGTDDYRGEAHHATKLTEDDVRAIRKDQRCYTEIIADYPISRATVTHIKKRQTWKHVADIDLNG